MRYIFSIILLLFAPRALAQGSLSSTLLTELGRQLHQLRAMPMGAYTNAHCPDGRDSLVGTERQVLKLKLGTPDYIGRHDLSWSYFFTSPVPVSQNGGGFPELTFIFSKGNRVASVTCYYSK